MFRIILRGAFAALCLACAAAAGAQEAAIAGRVLGAGGAPLEGASVTLVDTGRRVATARDGGFRLTGLEARDYTVRVEYAGYAVVERNVAAAPAPAVAEFQLEQALALDPVRVSGRVSGQARAIAQQRAADNLTTAVAAEAIGQLPDQNTAEALQRVAGVSITRDQGEGRFVVVRGADPNLNAVTINGARVPSAESDQRQVALDVVPSDLLAGLVVTKALTPDMDADAIGGAVEIKTLSAFDHGGRQLALRVEEGYTDLTGETNPRLAFNYSDIKPVGAGDLGIAFAISRQVRRFGSDNGEQGDGWPEEDDTGIRFPESVEHRDYTVERTRLGAVLNLDYHDAAGDRWWLRTLYSDFEDSERRLAVVHEFDGDEELALDEDSGSFANVDVNREIRSRRETQTIASVSLGAALSGAVWQSGYELQFAQAEEDEPHQISAAFEGGGFDVDYERRGTYVAITGANPAYLDPAEYELAEVSAADNYTRDREAAAKVDFSRAVQFGAHPGEVKLGLKLRQREKFNDGEADVYDGFPGDPTLAEFALAGAIEHGFAALNPMPDVAELVAYVRQNRAAFSRDDAASDEESLLGDFLADEDVLAAYAMAKADVGALRVLGGLRVERTEFDARGNFIDVDEDLGTVTFGGVREKKSYTDVLPGLHLRWEPKRNLVWRGAVTRTLVRPNIVDAAPFVAIAREGGEVEAEAGNPALEPMRSTNLDVSLEWYPAYAAVLSAGVFHKSISDFVVLADVAGGADFPTFDEVIQPVNGDSATVTGVELNAARRLGGGFFVAANLTLTDSEAELPLRDGAKAPLPRQSDTIGNLQLGWERDGMSFRVAASHRSAYLDSLEEPDDPAFDVYVDDHTQIDFSAQWRFADAWSAYFEAINLNDEPFYAYFGSPRFPAQYEEYGPTYLLGVKGQF